MKKPKQVLFRDDAPYNLAWVLAEEDVRWRALYRDTRWTKRVCGPGYAIPESEEIEAQVWCMENCRGRWGTHVSTRLFVTHNAAIFSFENDMDAVQFRLAFHTVPYEA